MLRVVVNVLEQFVQLGLKDLVVVRAAQPPLGPKLAKRDAAVRTRKVIGGVERFVGGTQRQAAFVGVLAGAQILLRTRFAEMKLLDLTFPNLGDVQSGRLGTPTALLHHVTRKREPLKLR